MRDSKEVETAHQTQFKRESVKVMGKTVGYMKATFEKLLEMGGWQGSIEAFHSIL